MTLPQDMPRSADPVSRETAPVFADPSGQRRRVMRVLGAAASVMMVGALIVLGIGLFGGPDTPFSVFGAPTGLRHGHPDPARAGKQPGSQAGRSVPGQTAPGARHRVGSAAPSQSGIPPRPRPSSANKAGKTPQGRTRSRRPHPSPSSHGR